VANVTTVQVLTDLRTELLADAGIVSAIGQRLYMMQAPQRSPRPYAVYNVIAHVPTLSHDGDYSQARIPIQVDVYADSEAAAISAADAIKAKLIGLTATRGSTSIQVGVLDAERSEFEPETELRRVSIDFDILFAT